jgi:MtN3 and saliva related transmembrane protein
MESMEYIGLLAGALTTFSFIPQVKRVFKLKSAREISVTFNISILTGIILWLVYGVAFNLIPVIVWNAITGLLVIGLLIGKMKYNR